MTYQSNLVASVKANHKIVKEHRTPGQVAVYIPFAYAFSGEMYIVPASYVTFVEISAGEWMKFIISGGVTKV